jgi:hypothetical protein
VTRDELLELVAEVQRPQSELEAVEDVGTQEAWQT